MQSLKYVVLVGVLGAGMTSLAHATLTFLDTETLANVNTPDSGMSAMLLGGALLGVGAMRRYLKR